MKAVGGAGVGPARPLPSWAHRATQAPSSCGCWPATPAFEVVAATANSQRRHAVADRSPVPGRGLPGLRFGPPRSRCRRGRRPGLLRPPHGASQKLVPELLERAGHVVDLAADFRLKDAGALPGMVRRGAHVSRAAGRGRLRLARAGPDEPGRRPPGGRGRMLRDRRHPGPGPPGQGRPRRARRESSSTRPVGCRGRGASWPRAPSFARWTRTSPPTACSLTATPRRWSRPSGPSSSSPPTWPP